MDETRNDKKDSKLVKLPRINFGHFTMYSSQQLNV